VAPRDFAFTFVRPPHREYRFESTLLAANQRHIVLEHEAYPSRPLEVDGEEVMAAGYRAVWFLFKGEPYDVGRFYRPDGAWTGYYVDVLEPVRWRDADPDTLEPIVDLFLDLWITRDGEYRLLDEDEFDEAAQHGVITTSQARGARETVRRLTAAIERGEFPPEIVSDFPD
jgi:predicted RNA-binding protein associated with RNAse of E/G family